MVQRNIVLYVQYVLRTVAIGIIIPLWSKILVLVSFIRSTYCVL